MENPENKVKEIIIDKLGLEESEVISITKKEFDERVNNSDVFIKGCVNALSYRLRQLDKKMQK